VSHVKTLAAAVSQHVMEHGVKPHYILTSADVAKAIFQEVDANPQYRSMIHLGGPHMPMRIDLGTGPIEIAQCTGVNRVELLVDYALAKELKRIGRA
jgi:hypothetical protein